MDNKNLVQKNNGVHTKTAGLNINDPNIILPRISRTKDGNDNVSGLSEITAKKEKTVPVIVRSFHKDINDMMEKEKNSKEAIQIQQQIKKTQKEEIKEIKKVKQEERFSAVSHKKYIPPIVPVKEKIEVLKNNTHGKKIPEAPMPPYKKVVKTSDKNVIQKSVNEELKKNTPEQIFIPQKKQAKHASPSNMQKKSGEKSKEEKNISTISKKQEKQLLNIPIPKKPVVEDRSEAKFLDKKDINIPVKEIIFPKPVSAVGDLDMTHKNNKVEEKKTESGIVPQKKQSEHIDKDSAKMSPFSVPSPVKKQEVSEKKLFEEPEEKNSEITKNEKQEETNKLQEVHDIFDIMVSGEHVDKNEDNKKLDTVEIKEKKLEEEKNSSIIAEETKVNNENISKEVIFKKISAENNVKEKDLQFKSKSTIEKPNVSVENDIIKKKNITKVSKEEKKEPVIIPLEIHISQEELNTLKGDIVRIVSEIKTFEAQKDSILAKKDRVEREILSSKKEVDTIKNNLLEKQRREKEITNRIDQTEQKEAQTTDNNERHSIEQERWKQEDVRADIVRERLEVEEKFEKINSLTSEKEKELNRTKESFIELEHNIKSRTKETEEKKLKVRFGEIESKKKEIEDIQVALLEEKRRLDRLHEEFETKEEQYLKERNHVKNDKDTATTIEDKKDLEEKIISIQKKQREVEQKRWEAEKSLETVLEKITKSNEHYTTISKLEKEVLERISKAGK